MGNFCYILIWKHIFTLSYWDAMLFQNFQVIQQYFSSSAIINILKLYFYFEIAKYCITRWFLNIIFIICAMITMKAIGPSTDYNFLF